MNELTIIDDVNIENMIYEVRGKFVMLDSDLAKLYNCANGTKAINLAVKRNIERFPEDFYFQLTKEESKNILRFQFETTNMSRTLPYVFTEQGVAMLSSVLRTEIAAQVSVNIMRDFVTMKKYISNNLIEQKYINNQVLKNTEDIRLLQESFSKFEEKRQVNEIYFNGQIYDAYSKILDIFKEAKTSLIIVDSYADKTVLDMIRKIKVPVTLIVKVKSLLTELDINQYNKQYSNLKIIYNDDFHDRYFILDRNTIYHSGTSINRIGSKTFSINVLEDEMVKKSLLDKIQELF